MSQLNIEEINSIKKILKKIYIGEFFLKKKITKLNSQPTYIKKIKSTKNILKKKRIKKSLKKKKTMYENIIAIHNVLKKKTT